MKVKDLAALLGGEAAGDPETEVHGASGIHEVREGEVTFLSDPRLLGECAESKASCVIVKEFILSLQKPQIAVKNPLYAFARALEHFSPPLSEPCGISSAAVVSPEAKIGSNVSIHALAYIADDAEIGDETIIFPGVFVGRHTVIGTRCVIYPNVTIREKVKIGDRVIIHPGSVVGSDGFGYVFEGGRHHKIPQVGGVIIEDDVEIGANVTIDRATTGNTVVGKGSKIDNLVQIAHNVKIGEGSLIAAQTGIAGSTEVGKFVMMGGQVGVADHTRIDEGCMIGAMTGVFGHLTKGVYSGCPPIPHRNWLKSSALFARLPELNKKIKELEEMIKALERRLP
ncbi:MAG: UDP-3-O-(3-hydroxymyristoyl)glucosamine N-acyltransferase [Nitrospirae bacterium]|nr:UDP-3-O-(3-hydroxymyristoyl)glucosamine N-acyltransferase [Nitrospirota bacterium]